jgi:hypothetical protein
MIDFTRVAGFLSERREDVLASAGAAIGRAHLPHYDGAGRAVAIDRLRALYALVERCAAERHLTPIAEYAARLARERHAAGIELGEVQTAINVLEEAIWHAVLTELPAEQQGEALGVVGTILGTVKDRLACAYVSLATSQSTRTLDFAELFHGPGEGDVPAA